MANWLVGGAADATTLSADDFLSSPYTNEMGDHDPSLKTVNK